MNLEIMSLLISCFRTKEDYDIKAYLSFGLVIAILGANLLRLIVSILLNVSIRTNDLGMYSKKL